MRRKIIFSILTILSLAFISWPLLTYNKALSLLESYPEKNISVNLNQEEVEALWKKIEPQASIGSYQNITPYWYYQWLSTAIASDYLCFKNLDPSKNMSVMASQIAINHMRVTSVHKHTKGMLWWHLLHASLSIHIQRNWSAKEIVEKYNAINS